MSERTWHLFAYQRADQHAEHDLRRHGIPEWRLAQAINWAVFRGYDAILVELTDAPPSSTREKTHHLCRDPLCPGGCN